MVDDFLYSRTWITSKFKCATYYCTVSIFHSPHFSISINICILTSNLLWGKIFILETGRKKDKRLLLIDLFTEYTILLIKIHFIFFFICLSIRKTYNVIGHVDTLEFVSRLKWNSKIFIFTTFFASDFLVYINRCYTLFSWFSRTIKSHTHIDLEKHGRSEILGKFIRFRWRCDLISLR